MGGLEASKAEHNNKKTRTSFVGHFAIIAPLDVHRDTNEGASNGVS